MVKGSDAGTVLLVLAGLTVSVYPFLSGYMDSLPGLDSEWSLAHSGLLLLGGLIVAAAVGLDYRIQQNELTRVTRAGKGHKRKVRDSRDLLRDSFITGWVFATMLLLSIGVGFYYADVNANFSGMRPAHALLFGFYLGAVIALPAAMTFAKMAVQGKGGHRGRAHV